MEIEHLKTLRSLLSKKTDCPPEDVRVGIGWCSYKLGRLKFARNAYLEALNMDPHCIGAMLGMALLEHEALGYEGSLRWLVAAWKQNPLQPAVIRRICTYYLEQKNYPKAYQFAAKALECSSSDADRAESTRLLASIPEDCNNTAVELYKRREFPDALVLFQMATQCLLMAPKDSPCAPAMITALYNTARCHEEMAEYAAAQQIYKDVLARSPKYLDCYIRLGVIAQNLKLYPDAAKYFQDALEVDARSLVAHVAKVNLLMEMGLNIEAEEWCERILKLKPNHSFALTALGNIALEKLYSTDVNDKQAKSDQHATALRLFQQALRQCTRNAYATQGIGCLVAFSGEVATASELFEYIREGTVTPKNLWENLAFTYMKLKQSAKAIAFFTIALEKNKDESNVKLLEGLARAYYQCNQFEKCRQTLKQALTAEPEKPELISSLAECEKAIAEHVENSAAESQQSRSKREQAILQMREEMESRKRKEEERKRTEAERLSLKRKEFVEKTKHALTLPMRDEGRKTKKINLEPEDDQEVPEPQPRKRNRKR